MIQRCESDTALAPDSASGRDLRFTPPPPPRARRTMPARAAEGPAAPPAPPAARTRFVSVLVPCYNEEENVLPMCDALHRQFADRPGYDYELLFIDNASTDRTVELLRQRAAADKRVRVIVNTRNFGLHRSPLHGLLQTRGDAVVLMCADFQDPPELIPAFLDHWEQGHKVVAAVKERCEERWPMSALRWGYYRLLSMMSETQLLNDFTGFGLYDRAVIDHLRATGDHYPYLRGFICELGYPVARVGYVRPRRRRGLSKNRLYQLYAQAMNGVTSHSKLPLRLATFTGFVVALFSLLAAAVYLAYKLAFWNSFQLGLAPLVIGLFFFAAVQLVFLGIIGEYVGAIHGRLFQKWLVIEKERINFDDAH
jgi:glycosyltransferase involved in cell wall biosynthesis